MRGRLLKVGGALLAVGMVASCLLFLPPMLGISGTGEMDIRQAGSDAARGARGVLLLARPVFAKEGMTFIIEEEAGISAWTKIDGGIDLGKAATAFRIVERQTDKYVIGWVSAPGLSNTEEARAFVHKDGWIVVYSRRGQPTAEIIDVDRLPVTRLDRAVRAIATAARAHIRELIHYHFEYPDAEKLTVIFDRDSFRLKIPETFVVYERSYHFRAQSIAQGHSVRNWLTIDGRDIVSSERDLKIGTLTAAQLKLGVFQTVGVRFGGEHHQACGIAIVLIYKER